MGRPKAGLKYTYVEALAAFARSYPFEAGAPASWVASCTGQSVGNVMNVLDRLARAGTIRRQVSGELGGQVRSVVYWVPR